jgi:two-component SAPR family response regulator
MAAREMISGEPVIFVVENDWRTRRFICTVLKYSARALVVESSSPHEALLQARQIGRGIDILIADTELAGESNIDLARQIAAANPSMGVLLISARSRPPVDIPSTWQFLSIPFQTAAFFHSVSQLCCLSGGREARLRIR